MDKEVKVEKQESAFDDSWIGAARSDTATQQMARVKQENDSSQEPAPECSTACSPTDDDFSQQHYLIPGYNLIFIKEEEYGEIRAIILFIFIHQ
ncbi:uncharacterized protein LOC111061971 isoform X7 [Nilaparvata lugens]|uniref:uncharacterized protein LOC111061971 isoform X7 n=1 Tax=Nilaparvata lugens TaxID=108931 RepID=UPI00193D92F8|nr:uncharacterized protein LOC111061971 isoform X7 [Nilaparvata lugens]